MIDQAGALRDLVAKSNSTDNNVKNSNCKVISITSGKGGVGKSNFTIFLGKYLKETGAKVLLLDGDMGLANLHILTGVSAPYNLTHFLSSQVSLKDIIYNIEDNIDLISGVSGSDSLANLSNSNLETVSDSINSLTYNYDYIIIDVGAGIAKKTINLALAGDITIVVLTPDPTSLADAYATIKVLSLSGKKDYFTLINMVETSNEGDIVVEKLSLLTEKFLNLKPIPLGELPRSKRLSSYIRGEKSLLSENGLSEFTIKMRSIVQRITGEKVKDNRSFFKKLFS